MKPYCDRIEIAGSIRREKQSGIKDIELVCVPKWVETEVSVGLFGETETTRSNQLWLWAVYKDCPVVWIKSGTSEIKETSPNENGRYWRGLLGDGETKLDLFITAPENFGAQFLIRTGSAEFSQAVVTHGKNAGRPFAGGYVTEDGKNLSTPEERDVFELLGIKYVEPKDRHGWGDVRRDIREACL